MPNRIAMGPTASWEPLLAVAVTLAAIAGLLQFGSRVYTGAILHGGPTTAQAARSLASHNHTGSQSGRDRHTARRPMARRFRATLGSQGLMQTTTAPRVAGRGRRDLRTAARGGRRLRGT